MGVIKYKVNTRYNRDNIVKFLCSTDTDNSFITEKQAADYVSNYLKRIPQQIMDALEKEKWEIIITDESLEEKFGYNFKIYGLTDREYKIIYTYSYPTAIEYGLGHEIGHFMDMYLGNISDTPEWIKIFHNHTDLADISPYYFTVGYGEIKKEEYFADCFLMYVNEPETLKRCNRSSYDLFRKLFDNIGVITELINNPVSPDSCFSNGLQIEHSIW